MEKQNDHKKFSKKIWVLSAGIIVILAIVLFAGIKNGFFLRKGDKILFHVSGRSCGWILV